MTEQEAEAKWCHRAHNGEPQPCISARCMAWREIGGTIAQSLYMGWTEHQFLQAGKILGLPSPKSLERAEIINLWYKKHTEEPPVNEIKLRGYCGLAGKP